MPKSAAMNFFDEGAPKYLRCYEAKRNPPIDRYTIVFSLAPKFMGDEYRGRVYYVSANGIPRHPAGGFYQHGEAWAWEFRPCGSRVKWRDLPGELREVLLSEYCGARGIVPVVDQYGNVAAAKRRKAK
jgi:hypothetical protein